MERTASCNNATFSQAIIKSVSDVGIKFENTTAIVLDNAAYCKKAFKDVLSVVFSNSIHMRCLAHIVNFVSEVFRQHSYFKYTTDPIAVIKSAFLKKPGRKTHFLAFLSDYLPASEVKLTPEPVATRWNIKTICDSTWEKGPIG